MALLHRAELRPSKIELIAQWAPTQPWFDGEVAGLTSVGAFRFDDPEGEVGVETLLVRAGDGPVLQVPLTYRGAPLPGGERSLIATMEHSVLGTRWVYDAVGDPVYLATTAVAALTGGRQADLYVDDAGTPVRREPTALVTGSGVGGTPVPAVAAAAELVWRDEDGMTLVDAGALLVVVARVPSVADADALARLAEAAGAPAGPGGRAVLTGTWSGQTTPVTLAVVTAHRR